MVFNGNGPLVQWCNGFNVSFTSTTLQTKKIVLVEKWVKSSHLLFIIFFHSLIATIAATIVIELVMCYSDDIFRRPNISFHSKDHEWWDLEVFQDQSQISELQKYIQIENEVFRGRSVQRPKRAQMINFLLLWLERPQGKGWRKTLSQFGGIKYFYLDLNSFYFLRWDVKRKAFLWIVFEKTIWKYMINQ